MPPRRSGSARRWSVPPRRCLKSGDDAAETAEKRMARLIDELRIAAFCVGARDIEALRRAVLRRNSDWEPVPGLPGRDFGHRFHTPPRAPPMSSPPAPPPVRAPGEPLVRPRDAATLIVYRESAGVLEVLMGERHARHRFMPNRFVFPGGRIDPRDSRVRCAASLAPGTAAQLERRLSPARARAMAVAAIRETFEETGLIIGGPDPDPRRPPPRGWEGFFGAGFAPALGALSYIARAVTPPIRPVRFNARFFVVAHDRVTGRGKRLPGAAGTQVVHRRGSAEAGARPDHPPGADPFRRFLRKRCRERMRRPGALLQMDAERPCPDRRMRPASRDQTSRSLGSNRSRTAPSEAPRRRRREPS